MASILAPEVLLSLLVCRKRTGLLLLSRSRSRLTRSRPLDSYIRMKWSYNRSRQNISRDKIGQPLQPTSATPDRAALEAAAAELHHLS